MIADELWTPLYVVWIVGGTIFLLLRRRRPMTTLSWILAFWSVPLISGLVYFLLGPRRLDKQGEKRQQARRLAATVVPAAADELPEAFIAMAPHADLARVTRASGDREPAPKRATSIELFADGDSAYPAILNAIRSAEATLHLEYYIWQPDTFGTLLRDALVERARQGVTVRIVVDAIGAKNCRGAFWRAVVDAGGEVRKFNPPHPLTPQPGKLNFRSHRKIVIIDGRVAFTGGINVSDNNRSIASSSGVQAWRSTHLAVDGPPVVDLQSIFLEDWLYSQPVDAMAHRDGRSKKSDDDAPTLPADIDRWFPESFDRDGAEPAGPWVQIVDSGPDEKNDDIHLLFFTAITRARERLWITTPYFVPDAPIEVALESAAGRGVDVRIMIPANSDSKLVQAAAQTYSMDVAAKGARIWLYEPRMNHSKTMVVDDSLTIIGTANMDNRSFRLNFEVVAAIYDADVTARTAAMFEKDMEDSRLFDTEHDDVGLPHRILANTARLLSPLL